MQYMSLYKHTPCRPAPPPLSNVNIKPYITHSSVASFVLLFLLLTPLCTSSFHGFFLYITFFSVYTRLFITFSALESARGVGSSWFLRVGVSCMLSCLCLSCASSSFPGFRCSRVFSFTLAFFAYARLYISPSAAVLLPPLPLFSSLPSFTSSFSLFLALCLHYHHRHCHGPPSSPGIPL